MKSTKTILAVAIVIAGFAYAVGAGHPQFDSLKHRCCGPQPEDVRVYGVTMMGTEPVIIIPKVEGLNGFMLTDAFAVSGFKVFQDAGEGPTEIINAGSVQLHRMSPVPGFPLLLGSTITILGSQGDKATLIGYVY